MKRAKGASDTVVSLLNASVAPLLGPKAFVISCPVQACSHEMEKKKKAFCITCVVVVDVVLIID